MAKTLNLVDHLFAQGKKLQGLGVTTQAIEIFSQISALRNLPKAKVRAVHLKLARLYQRRGMLRLARRQATAALVLKPKDAKTNYLLGKYLLKDRHGHPNRALTFFATALKQEPNNPRYQRGKGMAELACGHKRGMASLRKAYQMAPDDRLVLQRYIRGLKENHLLEEAKKVMLESKFRLNGIGWFQKMEERFRFYLVQEEQMRKRFRCKVDQEKKATLLPLEQVIRIGDPAEEAGYVRHDGATVLPKPHIGLGVNRQDQRHAQGGT